jgi:hypothetical protein
VRIQAVVQAYQCDKCQTFYTDEPNNLFIRDAQENIVLEKDICEKCKEEIINLFTKPDYRYRL